MDKEEKGTVIVRAQEEMLYTLWKVIGAKDTPTTTSLSSPRPSRYSGDHFKTKDRFGMSCLGKGEATGLESISHSRKQYSSYTATTADRGTQLVTHPLPWLCYQGTEGAICVGLLHMHFLTPRQEILVYSIMGT